MKKGFPDHNKTFELGELKEFITDDTYYGGLLIRGIQEDTVVKSYPINGPLRVLCELFYMEGLPIDGKGNSIQLSLEQCDSRSGNISTCKREGLNNKEADPKREKFRQDFKRYKCN